MSRTKNEWIALGKKRIFNILDKYRVSYSRHLEIKISEAGPYNQRVEPVPLNMALRELKQQKQVGILTTSPIEIIGATDYGKAGDKNTLKRFIRLHELFLACSKKMELCGLMLERLIFEAVLEHKDIYNIIGTGPIYEDGTLVKPAGSEVLFFNGKSSFKNAGLDLFIIHKPTSIPIGIEAKNIREWLYPASYEVWRMIAKACLLGCLPVLASRKISYIALAGFFSQVGILGFQTQFQYFHPKVRVVSKYKIKEVVSKDGLGFAYKQNYLSILNTFLVKLFLKI